MYAHRKDVTDHIRYRAWLEDLLASGQSFGIVDLVLSGFIRIVTHPRIFREPTPLDMALAFAGEIRDRPNCVAVNPGKRHWSIFGELCLASGAKGNLVPDAWLAAIAIESGSEWVTMDRDYARFPGLRCRHPLER